ncbi:MAG TPA: NAD(P)-dependent alcohol dehydrogenase [Porticoccaceae bacterium]|nr:NAD(P)-dependent alcohol dehydrogenase [Porticoccaceae bacterium]HIK80151.1 NAD(P)-dependent alcohol dehydrogenase [Porticoccaceae bacterium]
MRQVTLASPGGLNNLKLVEVEKPTPKSDQVVVKVAASSLNYHDLLVALGQIPTDDGRILLSDCAGEIVAVGDAVTRWKVGDTAMSCCYPHWVEGPPQYKLLSFIGDNEDGYSTEYMAISEKSITRTPKGWTMAEAATLPCAGLTAWRALVDLGNLQAGETVLVQGTGGVSIFALQLAKSMGAKVIATSSSDEKLKRLQNLGADEVINYKDEPQWGKAVLAKTGGLGVDHVVEVGGGGTFGESVRAVKLGGHIALIGVLSGPAVSEIILPRIFMKQIRLSGIAMGNQQSQLAMLSYLDSTNIRPIISDTFDLSELAAAFQHQIDNKHFGKISISINQD